MTTAELLTAGLSFYSNAGSPTIASDLQQRKRAHFFLTKVAKRVWDAAPYWFRLADSTVSLTAGVGLMPSDFASMGTQGLLHVVNYLHSPLAYRPPDWIKYQLQNNPQSGIPQAYTLYDQSPLGTPRIQCWPTDNSILVLTSYAKKMPELVDAPLALHPTVSAVAGLPNGTYTYVVTFVSAAGETEGGKVSASVNTAGLFEINLADIRTWWGRTVTSRKIYRTEDGGIVHKLVGTVSDNVTTEMIDNTDDLALGDPPPLPGAASTGMEVFPEAFHESAIFDGLVYLLARSQGDGRDVMFDAKWERSIQRLWEEVQQGQGEVKAFPAFPGFPTGHPVWSRWQPPR